MTRTGEGRWTGWAKVEGFQLVYREEQESQVSRWRQLSRLLCREMAERWLSAMSHCSYFLSIYGCFFRLFVPFFPLFAIIFCLQPLAASLWLGSLCCWGHCIFSLSFCVSMSYFPFPLWWLWTLCSHFVTFLGQFEIFVGSMRLFVVILSPVGVLHLAVLIQHQFVVDLCPLVIVLRVTFWYICVANLGLILWRFEADFPLFYGCRFRRQ